MGLSSEPPPAYASASGAGPSAHGVAAGWADSLSSAASGEVDVVGFARAQDEPLLALRREGSPYPMGADADGAPLGCLGGLGDKSMPAADPSATPLVQSGDVPMTARDEVGDVSSAGQGGSPPDASMPDGSGGEGGGGACAAACGGFPPYGGAPGLGRNGKRAMLPWA